MSFQSNPYHGKRYNSQLPYLLQPRQRLNTLFAIHAIVSVFIGVVGYLCPHAANVVFLIENDRELHVAQVILKLFCSLIAAQGIMIWKARQIHEGEIKRAFVRAYFLCFLFSTIAIFNEHMRNRGVVSGRFFGVLKIIFLLFLTFAYGWFTFFQPPIVYAL